MKASYSDRVTDVRVPHYDADADDGGADGDDDVVSATVVFVTVVCVVPFVDDVVSLLYHHTCTCNTAHA